MDKEYIKSLISQVLKKEFNTSERVKILDYTDRLAFCCPCCGDSKDEHKKRGNLYLDTLKFVCFNEGCRGTIESLCKRFNVSLDPSKKLEIIEYLNSTAVSYDDFEDSLLDNNFNELIQIKDLENVFNTGDTDQPITDFMPVQPNGLVHSYLVKRGIIGIYQKNIYQAKMWKSEERYENIICLLNKGGNNVLSMQIRNLKEGKNRVFKIYNFETLYKWVHNVEIIDMDIDKLTLYNKLGYYFNIMNIDVSKTITIFEGYIDSLFYPNSIGVVGTNTDMRFIESNNLLIQYMYDNDYAGYKKAEEKIKDGFPVFLWSKMFEDIVVGKKSNDPHKLLYRISKVKDMNALNILVDNAYKNLKMWNYFSNSIYDLRYIPKKIFAKKV